VTLQAPSGALWGIVIETSICPRSPTLLATLVDFLLATVVNFLMLQTLILTFAPALNPLPLIVNFSPRTTVLGITFNVPVQLLEPGG
jgi:hypothetical protein